MTFRVHLADSAAADAEAAYQWIADRAPAAAARWFNGLVEAIVSLERFPTRCGIARESKKCSTEIRQMLYGRRPHIYRILFTIRKQDVFVLHIRHGARQLLAPEDISWPQSDE